MKQRCPGLQITIVDGAMGPKHVILSNSRHTPIIRGGEGNSTMAYTDTLASKRHGLIKIVTLPIALCLLLMGGCETVPIDPSDSSKPTVTIKVNGPSGYQPQTSVTYGNNTAQAPLEMMCIVEDPQGVKSLELKVSDQTVSTAYCGGSIYPGNFFVDNLPAPIADTLSGSSGEVPTKLAAILKISGILPLATNPPGVSGTCYPANNTFIMVQCKGGNWSSNAGTSTASKNLQVKFTF